MSADLTQLLREAWAESEGDDLLSRLARRSLIEGAQRDPALIAVVEELSNPVDRVTLELHIVGHNVIDHEAPARPVGQLLSRASRAVKELAKQAAGAARRPESLLVAALEPGSVKVLLRAPHPPRKRRDALHDDTLDVEPQTPEGLALVELVALMNHATNDDGTQLHAAVHGLKGRPRDAVRLVAKTFSDEGWTTHGQLRTPTGGVIAVSMDPAAAARLEDAARDLSEKIETNSVLGRVDGWVWSSAMLSFVPFAGGRPILASVPPELQAEVAELNARQANGVAQFSILVQYPSGDMSSPHRTYALTAFRPDAPPDSLPMSMPTLPSAPPRVVPRSKPPLQIEGPKQD